VVPHPEVADNARGVPRASMLVSQVLCGLGEGEVAEGDVKRRAPASPLLADGQARVRRGMTSTTMRVMMLKKKPRTANSRAL